MAAAARAFVHSSERKRRERGEGKLDTGRGRRALKQHRAAPAGRASRSIAYARIERKNENRASERERKVQKTRALRGDSRIV